jgi:hypothetical protein
MSSIHNPDHQSRYKGMDRYDKKDQEGKGLQASHIRIQDHPDTGINAIR